MDPGKLSAVLQWPLPIGLKAIQRFLGFDNYYRKFISHFSTIVKPLMDMMHKGANTSEWSPSALQAFETLKADFVAALLLRHPNPKLPFTLGVDASESGVGVLLFQQSSPDEPLLPCGFFSRKLSKPETKYDVGDRELLPIILALRSDLWFRQLSFLIVLPYSLVASRWNLLEDNMASMPKYSQLASCLMLFMYGFYVFFGIDIDFFETQGSSEFVPEQQNQRLVVNSSSSTKRHPLSPPYPYPYKFLLNAKEKCQKRIPFLVIMVLGESNDIGTRIAIRETWGNESNYDNVEVVTIFLVGLSPIRTDKVQDMIIEENDIYGDIVQQDFIDIYPNVTLKTLMGMEWVIKFCPNVSYVMKIDNDVFLNVDYLVHHLLRPGTPVRKNYFTGDVVYNTGPIRDNRFKWYVPEEVYPNNTYPPYCGGPGYVFSADMARKIYDVAQVTRVINIEDAFMGICLYELKMSPTNPPDGLFHGSWMAYNRCAYHKLVTVHHYGKKELYDVWADFWGKKKSGCPE
ncbi:beta-1,3-galactosyltransferase 1-like [Rhinophrynus dorsalis]